MYAFGVPVQGRFRGRKYCSRGRILWTIPNVLGTRRAAFRSGAAVSRHFGNYADVSDWHLVPGLVEGHPAILVFDPNENDSGPKYFMLLDWTAGKVATIRDFRHAPYVIDGADYLV